MHIECSFEIDQLTVKVDSAYITQKPVASALHGDKCHSQGIQGVSLPECDLHQWLGWLFGVDRLTW